MGGEYADSKWNGDCVLGELLIKGMGQALPDETLKNLKVSPPVAYAVHVILSLFTKASRRPRADHDHSLVSLL